ncbi:MAG: GFA family protein [Azoarcus sp.]|jgi:hypothetical protein|nr:GFA family protein [Azoarcus sp.]
MSEKTVSGHCLCGAVQVSAVLASHEVGVCHCTMCQHWTGGPMVSVACSPKTAFAGEEHVTVYPSSAWGERGFCKHCGSALFYRMKSDGSYYIPVGVLDDHEGLKLANEIFIDRKPDFYSFAEKTNKMTEAEVMAMFAAPSSET